MNNIFKSRIFKYISVFCFSLLLCFTFMFSSLSNNKLKASASDINSPRTLLVLPSVYLDFTESSTIPDSLLPSIYFTYTWDYPGSNTVRSHLCYYPTIYNNQDRGILDYSLLSNETVGSSTMFSITNLGGFMVNNNNGDNLCYYNIVDYITVDYNTSFSIDDMLSVNTAYIAIQRYNQTINGTKVGCIDYLVMDDSQGYLYSMFVLTIKRLPPLTNVDSSYVRVSTVSTINTVDFNSQTLIDRAEYDGYLRGLREGGGKGFDEGFDLGKQEGLSEGEKIGFDKATELYNKGGFMGSILSAVDGFLSVNLFGNFSLGDLLSLSFGFILLGLFLKLFLGG